MQPESQDDKTKRKRAELDTRRVEEARSDTKHETEETQSLTPDKRASDNVPIKKTRADPNTPIRKPTVNTIREDLRSMKTEDNPNKQHIEEPGVEMEDAQAYNDEQANVEDDKLQHRKRSIDSSPVTSSDDDVGDEEEEAGNGTLGAAAVSRRKRLMRKDTQEISIRREYLSKEKESTSEAQYNSDSMDDKPDTASKSNAVQGSTPAQVSHSNNVLSKFGGGGDVSWDDVVESDHDGTSVNRKEDKTAGQPTSPESTAKKYAFGATSGFGSSAVPEYAPPIGSKATFGSTTSSLFGSFAAPTSGFGAFAGSSSSPFASANSSEQSTKSPPPSMASSSGFGAFSGKASSPFAQVASPSDSKVSAPLHGDKYVAGKGSDDEGEDADDESEKEEETTTAHEHATSIFGAAGPQLKVPGVQETKIATGEENEEQLHAVKAKLFAMDEQQQWKERGVGRLTLLQRLDDHKHIRLVMRADAVLKVILNIPIFSKMHVEKAESKFLRLVAVEEGKPVNLAIKVGSEDASESLYRKLTDTIASLEKA